MQDTSPFVFYNHCAHFRLLVKHMDSAVSRETILEQVWGVSSHTNFLALNVQISYLRKALRNDDSVQIESLMKKGYAIKVS